MHSEYLWRLDYFEGDNSSLMIHLYLDELETTRPLEQSREKFKLLCIYLTLGTMPLPSAIFARSSVME